MNRIKEEEMTLIRCPHCEETNIKKSGVLPSGKQRYICKTCNKGFSTGTVPRKSVDNHVCPHCSGPLKYRGWNVSGHRRYKCKDCGKSCSGITVNLPPKIFNEEGISCPFCQSQQIKKAGLLRSGIKRYFCKNCNKGFSPKTVIRDLINVHCTHCHSGDVGTSGLDKDGSQRYLCHSCKRRFKLDCTPRTFIQHEKQCPRCGNIGAKKAGYTGASKKAYYICLSCNHKYLEHGNFKHLTFEQKQLIIKAVIEGHSCKQVALKVGCCVKTINNVLKEYYKIEQLTKQQKDLLLHFGVNLAVPVKYLHSYIPCTPKTCEKFLSKYNIVKPQRKALTERDKAIDKMDLERFIKY